MLSDAYVEKVGVEGAKPPENRISGDYARQKRPGWPNSHLPQDVKESLAFQKTEAKVEPYASQSLCAI
jgi:hypothetical protein